MMESPSSAVRRRAWINSSRQWLTLEERDSPGRLCSLSSASTVDDDVFSDGCISGKIENWLLGCGSEVTSENLSRLSFESALKAEHFDTELSLGADASILNGGEILSASGPSSIALGHSSTQSHHTLFTSTPRQALCLPAVNMGYSTASSCLSSSTSNSRISVLDVLRLYAEDPEETLFELGFGYDEPQFNIRIPSRFFTFPSEAKGINFRGFLESQLQRIRDEDPSLTLASRFRQVQVLTAMANAFYSLYSHVSRTPLQKLAPPELTFYSSPVEKMERFRSSIRSEPRSPVERLKDTVSKMCLYTGSPRGSESTSPQPSPKKRCSLSDVGELDQETVQPRVAKNLNLGESNRINSTADVHLASDTLHSRPKSCYTNNKNAVVDGNSNKAVGVDNKTQGARTSLSLETVDRGDNQCPLCQQELEPTGTPAATAAPEEPLSCCRPKPNTASCICSARRKDASSFPSFMPNVVSEHDQDNPTQPSPAHQNHGSISSNLQKVNSFELEEVHSAGEDDFRCLERTQETSPPSKEGHYYEVDHGDSTHSDSSGYAEDEISSRL
ncbi:protein TESPA1 isoform X1 [Takifugu rubripes]|uniref:protein TESPA1 isoform X1 n=1 Tax=Takifugu rubripes TaxID=31033 RepID=UPI0011458181|nr:protein TESPA1 isoform X1 [Takifugu rubripes]